MKRHPLRFGVVGTAYWAREVHCRGLRDAGLDLVGVWGRNPGPTEAVAKQFDATAFTTFEAMLDAVDVVSFAVPPEAQAPLALQAARRGLHLILEKPVARVPDQAHAIADAVRENATVAMVMFTRRLIPEIAVLIEAERQHGWTEAEVKVHSDVMRRDSPYAGSAWRQEDGAALWDIGPHVLSILTPMLGAVRDVQGERERQGVTVFRTWHESGATARVSVTLTAEPGEVVQLYRFIGRGRSIDLPEPSFSRPGVFGKLAGDLTHAVDEGRREHPCTLALGVHAVEVLAAVERSAGMGRRISVGMP